MTSSFFSAWLLKNMGLQFILDAVQASNIRSSRYRIFLVKDNSGETDMYNADRNLSYCKCFRRDAIRRSNEFSDIALIIQCITS